MTDEIYKILPAYRLRFANSELWLDTYQPKNEAWCPIKHWDYHTIKEKHLEELRQALAVLTRKVEERKTKPPESTDAEWDEKVPDGVWVWLRERHPKVGITTRSELTAYLNDPANTVEKTEEDKRLCPVCRKETPRGSTLCQGHQNAFRRWSNQKKQERLEVVTK